MEFEVVIGLEVHAQLKTDSKIFVVHQLLLVLHQISMLIH